MTAVAPPAHKYKDDPSDDSVSAVYCFLFSLFPCLDKNTMNGRAGSCSRANWDDLFLLSRKSTMRLAEKSDSYTT